MCTSITLQTLQNELFFGRNMDFSYDIDPHMYIIPRDYTWSNELDKKEHVNLYSYIGIGQEVDNLIGFFDGVNEHGLAAAVLYFPGYAQYNKPVDSMSNQIVSYDFLNYILGNCKSIEDLIVQLSHMQIVGLQDPLTHTIAPLHWIATDRTGACIVIEPTSEGVRIYDNSIGVLANSPSFPWQISNLRNYMSATPNQMEEADWGNIMLTPFSQGGGTSILPGGFTSPERFVRTAYLKSHIPVPATSNEAVNSCFHLLGNVSVPRGAVMTVREKYDYTIYTAFINVDTCEYYFNTCDNLQIRRAYLSRYDTKSRTFIDLGSLFQPMEVETFN